MRNQAFRRGLLGAWVALALAFGGFSAEPSQGDSATETSTETPKRDTRSPTFDELMPRWDLGDRWAVETGPKRAPLQPPAEKPRPPRCSPEGPRSQEDRISARQLRAGLRWGTSCAVAATPFEASTGPIPRCLRAAAASTTGGSWIAPDRSGHGRANPDLDSPKGSSEPQPYLHSAGGSATKRSSR